MLAKRRGFYRDGKEVIRTPLLLPSFSSKGFPEVKEIILATSERIEGPCLVSAYDLYHGKIEDLSHSRRRSFSTAAAMKLARMSSSPISG